MTISKDGDKPPLEFECTVVDGTFKIDFVCYDTIGDDEEHVAYEGPTFE